MVEKRTIAEIALVILFMASLGIIVTHEDAVDNIYTCKDKAEDRYCFDVRDYSDKIDYRCLYNETNQRKYFSCNSGWEKITLQEALEPVSVEQQNVNQWECFPPEDGECISKVS